MAALYLSPRRTLVLAALTVVSCWLGFFAAASLAVEEEKGVLASLISRALTTPESRISIGAIDGALSSEATIRDLQIQDRDGLWLKVNSVRINWRRLALLQRRLEIDKLDIDRLDVLRKPAPAEAPVSNENEPLLPELPVKVDIKEFSLATVNLGAPVLGVPASFSMGGNAKLGPPSEGLVLFLDGERLDQPASLNVRLNLVPEGERLSLSINLDEPAGGILSHIANIPGRPPVKFNLGGEGTLDAFEARLAFNAGPDIAANGAATLNREGTARRLNLDLAAQVSGLLPDMAAPIFAGTTKLTGNAVFGDDGAIAVPGIALAAAAARLDINGSVSAAQVADIRISAENISNAESRTLVSGAEIRHLAFDAHVTGPLDAPSIDSSLAIEDAHLPAVSLAKLNASFKAAPNGSIVNSATLLQLSADARIAGLDLKDPALARAIGHEASFTMKGAGTIKGFIDFETLELKSETVNLHFKGRAGGTDLKGQLNVEAPDLSRFGPVAGLGLKGEASLAAELEGTPRLQRFIARVDAKATRFATGIGPVDGLYGGKLALQGGIKLDPDGAFGFDDLRLTGPNASARINGAATSKLADVTAEMSVPNLSDADRRLSGRGEILARLTGTLNRPDAMARVSITDATMLGRPVPRLEVEADAVDLRGALDARLTLNGEIDRKPAQGALHIARPAEGGTILDGMVFTIGSVAVNGALAFDPANFANGQISIRARDLNDLSPLVLQKLSGTIDAEVTLDHAEERQDAAIKAEARGVEAGAIGLDKLSADLALTDIYRHPVIAGSVMADQARIGGETISRIRLNAKGTPEASDVTVTAAARGLDLNAAVRVLPADPIRIELSRFDAARGRDRIGLAGPASIIFEDDGIVLRNLALRLGNGRLSLEGHIGSSLDLKATARAVPLSAANILAPDLGLSGTLDGETTITGASAAPTGAYRFRIANLSVAAARNAGLPALDVNASGQLEGASTRLEATLAAGQAGSLRIAGSAPLSATGVLDLTIKGNIDASLANRSIAAAGRRLTGRVAVDGLLTGTPERPEASGSLALSNGSFQDALLGVRLDAIRARLTARGDRITLDNASATTKNGGSLAADGNVQLDPAGDFPGTIRIRGHNAQLVESPQATAVANLDLDISGPLARDPRISGRIDNLSLDVPVPDRLPQSLQPLPGTRHIAPPPTAAARLALAARNARGKGAPVFNAALDLTIAAPGRIHVHGRGLDTWLGGNLRLTGTLAEPKPVGAFNLVQGRLRVLTTQLDFTRANLTFAGDLSPELDFLASTQAGGASITIAITGHSADPQFAFMSSPDLPQDEIFSRLLFGTSSGQLSPTQALSLVQAVAIYSGGNSALEGLRRTLGLGDSSGSKNPLTNLLGDRVSLGVRTGATPAQTGIGADISIYKQFKVKGSIDATGGASAGVGAEFEW